MSNTVRVYVGADRSQALAIKVLEHSIKRHSSLPVEVFPMIDLDVPKPKDPRNSQRTGFSFSRYCIPSLAGHEGRAIYLDADMIVFKDIATLWNIDIGNAKIGIQADVENAALTSDKSGIPKKRIKQSAVMILDCSRLKWEIEKIIDDLDSNQYTYEDLMYYLCILSEEEIAYAVPSSWNSLEYFDSNTHLLHYTDMGTQPWVSTKNKNGELWLQEVRLMLESGALTYKEIEEEINLGYFRPSLIRDIIYGNKIPKLFKRFINVIYHSLDHAKGFIPHKKVYEVKAAREIAVKALMAQSKKNT